MKYVIGGKDACQGDSGGPMYTEEKKTGYLVKILIGKALNKNRISFLAKVGIVSSGAGDDGKCSLLNHPGLRN